MSVNWLSGLLILVAVAAGAAGIFVWLSSLAFTARIDELRERMVASQQNVALATTRLPEIVRAYAVRAGGRVGAPTVFHARHKAKLATSPAAPPITIEADQLMGIVTPGIVWVARGSLNGLPVTVLDAYVEGRGELSARVLSTFQVAGGTGADYDKGELMRYLSELPVHPDAILNSSGLSWRQLDDCTVEVSAQSLAGTSAVRFIFDAAGDIVGLEADDRPMARDDGTTVPTPWRGTYGDYRQFGRYRIPSYGEVGWELPTGSFTYWRGRLVSYETLSGRP
jgi:hypothetical protein